MADSGWLMEGGVLRSKRGSAIKRAADGQAAALEDVGVNHGSAQLTARLHLPQVQAKIHAPTTSSRRVSPAI
jgi:hypothetical protein